VQNTAKTVVTQPIKSINQPPKFEMLL
jgi:hypothetical protein